ncbi:sigma 54-interacting transcriptional regulator [Brevibacillus sp. SYP-B805]|uniref:sigma 54-interacting transcriptional regulator n=1 Tax=Brevibacillus sp. SYP-B805 TaxID=1578199 RepID=UPI0013ECFEA6|nr:sigma 54-interacting transcriptional regulator [Brevibacillus sp. SYP-B805]NGQ96035.1 sigma 54-interacting transcriptional regulator [Brevibacillus sp. SYP-B805]
MRERVRQIIAQEDKKKPLTDEQIASRLGLRRDEVTLLRHQLKIPDSRKRRHDLLKHDLEQLLKQNARLTTRELTKRLKERGYDVSRFTVQQLRSQLQALSADQAPVPSRPRTKAPKGSAHVTFAGMIGAKGTLKAAIQQAQAAVLYPPHGLHTLLFGATGVGKSRMAEAMYHFAVEQRVMKPNAPFVVFNCADYAKNPQLLLSQLFGYVKGAFTGAQQDKPGLVVQADGGILFLDEIHRLPPEGQENLFYLIDKGVYRRLGEVQFQQKANILIVGATTESPESSLLLTLRRRIPMTIELPSLADWTPQERLSLIFHFFNEEADRIGKELVVQREVIAALLTYDCPGNAGQLHSDIRVLLAKAFLKTMHQEKRGEVRAERVDLPMHLFHHLAGKELLPELPMLKKEHFRYIPGQRADLVEGEEEEQSVEHLYTWVIDRYQNLKEQGHSEELIQLIVHKELDSRMETAAGDHDRKRTVRLQQLARLVGEQVVQTVEKMLWIAERHLVLDYPRISFALAIHLRGLLDRDPGRKWPDRPIAIDTESMEYRVASEMAKVVQSMWEIVLPRHEKALLAMYLKQCSVYTEPKALVGMVVASYGQVAKSMVDVANRLFGKKHALAVELYWNDDIEQAIQRIGMAIQQADQGEGVVLLADMGCNMLSEAEWQARLGVRVKVVSPVSTTLVVEVMRKCLYASEGLEQMVQHIQMLSAMPVTGGEHKLPAKPVAIITICLTGNGAALMLEALLREKLAVAGEQIVILSASSLSVRQTYDTWRQTYHILAVVGTINPFLEGVPFVSVKEIADETGISFIKRLLAVARDVDAQTEKRHSYRLRHLLNPHLIVSNLAASSKEEVIERLASLLDQHGCVGPQFLQKVWEREKLGSTCLLGVAIPHADTSQTIQPAIAIAQLVQPVEWEPGTKVHQVIMLALTENCQPAVEELYQLINDHHAACGSLDLQALLRMYP